MDRVAGCDLLDGALSLERFDGDLRFQRCAELPSVLSHVCLIRQRKSTLGPCPNFGEYLTDADAAALTKPIRDAIWSIDPNLPIAPALTMEQRVSQSVATPRFLSILFAVFAAISLLLSCSGVLSSLLYTVSERRRELGIRLALGATNSDLLRLMLGYGLMISLSGITIGIISASALSSLLSGLLWNVKPTDPTTFVGVSIILSVSALVAAFLPAWNASRTDPMQTLRGD